MPKEYAKEISGVIIVLNRFSNFQLAAVAAAVIAVAFVLAVPCLGEDWNSYIPVHSLGSGDEDWWTTYPDQNENSGSAVNHPDWIMKALKEKPVLILVHSSNCVPCLTQTPRIKAAAESVSSDLDYYDILGEGSSLQKAIEILEVYDPFGSGKPVVPTTIFITLAKGPDGKVDVAWHSEIDAMSQENIDDYVKDSIYYYKQNSAAWA
ncbi:MAG: thioredoxin family protein [Methanothrix sp.]|nr:thioredoxin family protein [Methanothrix sp.]